MKEAAVSIPERAPEVIWGALRGRAQHTSASRAGPRVAVTMTVTLSERVERKDVGEGADSRDRGTEKTKGAERV